MGKAPKFEGFNITEREIRYAMANSKNNSEAAEFLRIHKETYKKYAKLYIDPKTGKSLFELHKAKGYRSRRPRKFYKTGKEILEKILAGELKPPPAWKFKYFLLREGIIEESCARCGFNEGRITDGKIPLIFLFLDGNTKNGRQENIQLLCYNCYMLTIGNIWGRPKKTTIDIPTEFLDETRLI